MKLIRNVTHCRGAQYSLPFELRREGEGDQIIHGWVAEYVIVSDKIPAYAVTLDIVVRDEELERLNNIIQMDLPGAHIVAEDFIESPLTAADSAPPPASSSQ